MYTRFFYSPEGDGGGTEPPKIVTMADAEAAALKARQEGKTSPTDTGGIQGGGGSKKTPVIPTSTPPEGKRYAADGVTLEDDPDFKKETSEPPPAGKKYDTDGKTLIDDPNYKPDEDKQEDEEDFWAEVEKRTGVNIKVDYPEGVDPATVE